MNGRNIEMVQWPDTESEQGRCMMRGEGIGLHLSATYHGDHDEFWIVQTNAGVEQSRHNTRYVESIIWAK